MYENGSPEALAGQTQTLEELVERFEAAWRQQAQPVIEDFLPTSNPLRMRVLAELLYIDLEFRLKAGQHARVEDALSRFPELSQEPQAVVALIVTEYRFRR